VANFHDDVTVIILESNETIFVVHLVTNLSLEIDECFGQKNQSVTKSFANQWVFVNLIENQKLVFSFPENYQCSQEVRIKVFLSLTQHNSTHRLKLHCIIVELYEKK
jgi:hypothetical protein